MNQSGGAGVMKVEFVLQFCCETTHLGHCGVTGPPNFTADLRGRGGSCRTVRLSMCSMSHDLHSGRKAGIAQSV
jgi:hypothetical protein